MILSTKDGSDELFGIAANLAASLLHIKLAGFSWTYKQLLQQQENSVNGFVQILMDSTYKRMDDLTREVQDLKNSLQFSQGQLNELKQKNAKMTAIKFQSLDVQNW